MSNMEKNGSKKTYKPRPVRHTATSLMRIVKANPLLQFETVANTSTIKDKLPIDKVKKYSGFQRSQSLRIPLTKPANIKPEQKEVTKEVKPIAKPHVNVRPAGKVNNYNNNVKENVAVNGNIKTNGKKRILEHCFRTNTDKKAVGLKDIVGSETAEIPQINVVHVPDIMPKEIQKPEENKQVTFKTPQSFKRRSVAFFTPNTMQKPTYTPYTSTPAPDPSDLQRRLNNWLKNRGKSLSNYHHLKCFGIDHDRITNNVENKENIEQMPDLKKGSYEDLKIIDDGAEKIQVNEDTENESEKIEKNLDVIAKDALRDLHKLILEGYAKEQCEAWLGTIRKKYKRMEREPEYWECLAALEEAKGNITSAVECYRNAIVQGAEVKAVDESLEHLLEKFSLLNISSAENGSVKHDRHRIVLDARNAFKSSIIQFAIQERKMKKCDKVNEKTPEKKLLLTPVRRSTRKSRTGYITTPDVELFSSIKEAQESQREIEFRYNDELANKFK